MYVIFVIAISSRFLEGPDELCNSANIRKVCVVNGNEKLRMISFGFEGLLNKKSHGFWKIRCADQKTCATGNRTRGKTKTHAQKYKQNAE